MKRRNRVINLKINGEVIQTTRYGVGELELKKYWDGIHRVYDLIEDIETRYRIEQAFDEYRGFVKSVISALRHSESKLEDIEAVVLEE